MLLVRSPTIIPVYCMRGERPGEEEKMGQYGASDHMTDLMPEDVSSCHQYHIPSLRSIHLHATHTSVSWNLSLGRMSSTWLTAAGQNCQDRAFWYAGGRDLEGEKPRYRELCPRTPLTVLWSTRSADECSMMSRKSPGTGDI